MAIRLFLDSSALFAAAYSPTGAARELIRLSILGEVQIVISQDVVDESLRNLKRKAPHRAAALQQLLQVLEIQIMDSPSPAAVRQAEAYVVQKDAMILASVREADVSFFVTLDRKHLLGNPALEDYAGKKFGTPQEALLFVRGKQESD